MILIILTLALSGTAQANGVEGLALALQDPFDSRLAAVAQDKPAEKPPADVPITLSWRDGLQFKADDGNFQATLGGRVLAHYRTIFDRPDNGARTNPDTLYLRQARIDFQGKLYKEFDFRLYLDFPTGAAAVAGTVQDAYLGWSRHPEFTVKVGQFKVPFSQEQTTTLRATDFVERTVLDRLAPGRDLGVLFSGKIGAFEYEVGAFDGAGRAVVDNNDEKDVAARFRVTPIDGLRLGVAGTFGDVDSGSFNALDLTTTELQIQFLDATAGVVDGKRTRIGAELTFLRESFGLRAEWVRRTDTVTQGTLDEDDVDATAWYAGVSWLLTGEKKTLEARIVPKSSFADGGWGAFELAVRAAGLSIDDEIFSAGVAPAAGNADKVTTFTVGINWYLTRNVRISPNFVVEKFNEEIAPNDKDRFHGALVRFQIDF
ncbi:MAG TPA: porin [Planctomycetota bacterium]